MSPQQLFDYIEKNKGRLVADLRKLVKQPSISSQDKGLKECAKLLKELMGEYGIEARVIRVNNGNPIVFGEVDSSRSQNTLLMYSHYDVQPVTPIKEWVCDPFEAKIIDNKIVGRGTSDAKGNLMTLIGAVDALQNVEAEAPLNLKFLFEGEEEVSSPNLEEFVKRHKALLEADAAVFCDGEMDPSGNPLISLGLKGMLYVEFIAQSAKVDLHSSYAPLVKNPAWELIRALQTIKSSDEKITIDGWYDAVHPPSPEELTLLQEIPFDMEKFKRSHRILKPLDRLTEGECLKALLYEPTCNISGFVSGYTGRGSKTVLPNKATVKVDFRLVYDQDPDDLFEKLKRHLKAKGFGDIQICPLGSTKPSKTPLDAPIAQVAKSAAQKVYGVQPVIYPTFYGSGPAHVFTDTLGMDLALYGIAPAFSRAHAPNEFITIRNYIMGVKYASVLMKEFCARSSDT